MASLIDLLQQMRSGASGSLLGSDDFASCFDTLDATGEGFISLEQVAKVGRGGLLRAGVQEQAGVLGTALGGTFSGGAWRQTGALR